MTVYYITIKFDNNTEKMTSLTQSQCFRLTHPWLAGNSVGLHRQQVSCDLCSRPSDHTPLRGEIMSIVLSGTQLLRWKQVLPLLSSEAWREPPWFRLLCTFTLPIFHQPKGRKSYSRKRGGWPYQTMRPTRSNHMKIETCDNNEPKPEPNSRR